MQGQLASIPLSGARGWTMARYTYWKPVRRKPSNPEDMKRWVDIRDALSDSKYDPLPKHRQEQLSKVIARSSPSSSVHQRAREQLWCSWRRFAFVAASHFVKHAPFEDLFTAADHALYEATLDWRYEKGASLATWARMRMRSACPRVIKAYQKE